MNNNTPNKNKNFQAGQTITEVIIVIGIVAVGFSVMLSLSISSFLSSQDSSLRIQALNFAREGLEAVRNIRDGNSFKRSRSELYDLSDLCAPGEPPGTGAGECVFVWNQGMYDGTAAYNYVVRYDARYEKNAGEYDLIGIYPHPDNNPAPPANGLTEAFPSVTSIETCMDEPSEPCHLGVITGGAPLGFSVPVNYTDDIPWSVEPEVEPGRFHRMVTIDYDVFDAGPPKRSVIKVISTVAWKISNKVNKVVIEEWMYDWQESQVAD